MGGLGGGGMSLIVALVAAVAPGAIPLAMIAWVTICYFIARAIYVSRFNARERELRPVVDQIAALVEAPGARLAAPEPGPPAARVRTAATTVQAEADIDEEDAAPDRGRRSAK
jgi:hypothetical protein